MMRADCRALLDGASLPDMSAFAQLRRRGQA